MKLKQNILANYSSQIYLTLVGILLLPMYIKYMGAEAYGLIGFFSMLQAWFNMLDMGLTPTLARETARFRGGATDAVSYRQLVRALVNIFFIVAFIGGTALFVGAEYIASHWLQATKLPVNEVKTAVRFMAIIIAMRWMCGLYRGEISGFERLVWLGWYNSLIATIRFVGVLPVLILIGASPSIFFSYQFIVAALELAGLMAYSNQLLPRLPEGRRLSWSWAPLKPVLKFSLTIAFTSSVWVLVTQTDKLILSKLLSLEEYGYFTVAVLLAGGVTMISGPVSGAILPRMAKLEAEGNYTGLIALYRQSTQLVAIVAGAASIVLALNAEMFLVAWTGDKVLAHYSAPILILYATGNSVLAVSAFPFYLQYAKGDLKLHLIGNAVFVFLLIPIIIWAASKYGGTGAGYVWLVMNLITFFVWLPFIHRKFAPGLNAKWYLEDVLIIFLSVSIVGYFINALLPKSDDRWWQLGEICFTGLLVLLAGMSASSVVWRRVKVWSIRGENR